MVDLCIGKHRLVPDFLKFLRLTDRYGNEDVWEYLLDTKIKWEWVDIRDLENKIMYSGCIHLFSETEKIRELYLLNVIVYDFEGNELYRVPQMYMSRPSETVIMELRSVIEAKGKDDEKKMNRSIWKVLVILFLLQKAMRWGMMVLLVKLFLHNVHRHPNLQKVLIARQLFYLWLEKKR